MTEEAGWAAEGWRGVGGLSSTRRDYRFHEDESVAYEQ